MKPLADWPLDPRAAIRGVLTDIDDTLTTDGAITDDALRALADLKREGLPVFAVTGRPVGWSEPFARSWPVDAIVAENGAVALYRDPSGAALRKIYRQGADERERNWRRMQAVLGEIEASVPGARRARDSTGRECDIAIDHSEFVHLSQAAIDQCVTRMQAAGMNASVSSIHINGWYGDHDKLDGARWIVRERLGRSLDQELAHWVYVGDSTNDEIMFQHVPNSVGVANIRRFQGRLEHLPAWVCEHERGAGFAELTRTLLAARG